MKIGILTQPLHTNYGGLLQCWALQRALREMGHEAWVVQRQTDWHSFRWWAGNAAKNVHIIQVMNTLCHRLKIKTNKTKQ